MVFSFMPMFLRLVMPHLICFNITTINGGWLFSGIRTVMPYLICFNIKGSGRLFNFSLFP